MIYKIIYIYRYFKLFLNSVTGFNYRKTTVVASFLPYIRPGYIAQRLLRVFAPCLQRQVCNSFLPIFIPFIPSMRTYLWSKLRYFKRRTYYNGMRALLFFLIVLYYFGDLLVYFDKPFGYIRIPGRKLSVLYSKWLPSRSEFSLNFTLINCVHFSIERIRPLFRVKWRLFSQTTQHVLVVSNSSKAMMILIARSDSWHRLLHFQCPDWVTQFTKVLLAEFFFTITSSARFHETKNLFKRLCTTSLLQLSMS